ncbi:hypothetical protein [Nonomuraea sp. NPDC005692]|uniref:hypothetical protein n=1 Tax=Nonomuraea sp. NPDC005692 TaxID=3157168 RepID=UPI0033E0D3EB
MKWYYRLYVGGTVVSEIKGRLLFRLRAEQDARTFSMTKHVFIDSKYGVLTSSTVSFPTLLKDPAYPGNTTNCARGAATGTGAYSPDAWAANTNQWQIVETFYANRRTGYHEIGECTLTGSMKVRFTVVTVGIADPVSDTVRCDKSPSLGWLNSNGGGCVVMDVVPAFTMTRTDQNPNGVSFPNIYDHIKRALDPAQMQNTNPVPGGQMFPDISGPKSIPGGSARRPLHRTPYSSEVISEK